MTNLHLQAARDHVWKQVDALDALPRYPAIVRRVAITAREEEYFDRELEYDEKYEEELTLREGLVIAHFEQKAELLGIGDCLILDIAKRTLLRTPRISRCGLVLPMIPYQGSTSNPQDYLTYFETINARIQAYCESYQKDTIRCPDE